MPLSVEECIADRQKKGYQWSMEPVCEMCCMDSPLDECCELFGREIPYAGTGCCGFHLGDRGPISRKVLDIENLPEASTTEAEMERWGIGEGRKYMVESRPASNLTDNDTLLEFDQGFGGFKFDIVDDALAFDLNFGSTSLPPVYDQRPQSADPFLGNYMESGHRIRRVSSCL
jgi:hypothetical protein